MAEIRFNVYSSRVETRKTESKFRDESSPKRCSADLSFFQKESKLLVNLGEGKCKVKIFETKDA